MSRNDVMFLNTKHWLLLTKPIFSKHSQIYRDIHLNTIVLQVFVLVDKCDSVCSDTVLNIKDKVEKNVVISKAEVEINGVIASCGGFIIMFSQKKSTR